METKFLFSLPRFRYEDGHYIEDPQGPIVRYADVVAAEIARSAEAADMNEVEIHKAFCRGLVTSPDKWTHYPGGDKAPVNFAHDDLGGQLAEIERRKRASLPTTSKE